MSFDSTTSASSAGKPKRSRLDSNSSNAADKKAKNRQQKTIGGMVAWGANSISSSKSSSRKSPFTDFGSYMEEKNRKLRFQFQALSDSNANKGLLYGISIFVDGFTVPSSQELRSFMLKHGGRFENYFSRHRVTHIICSNLPDSKIKNIRSFSKGLPVVKPTWLLDSIAANRVLDWIPYQLNELVDNTRSQQKLSSFFTLKSSSSTESGRTPMKSRIKFEAEGSSSTGEVYMETQTTELCDRGNSQGQEGEESVCPGPATFFEVRVAEPNSDDLKGQNTVGDAFQCSSHRPSDAIGSCCLDDEKIKEASDSTLEPAMFFEVRVAEPSSTDLKDQNTVGDLFHCSPHRPSDTVSSCCLDDKKIEEASDSRLLRPPDFRHSTLTDPNFVENYFKNSRLHFIGTWRNRYRKRFPNVVLGTSHGNPGVCGPTASKSNAIIHIDMDCFFVSVVIRNLPELQDRPVAVCHSDNPKGTAEISSANYPARDYGVRAGIFVRDAKARYPHLVIVPYNFEAYEEVADQFYDILHKHCDKVQAVSCDEAFLDVTDVGGEGPEHLASKIRQEIFQTTGCTASAGIAGNLLLARLATRNAKPNGQCFIPADKVDGYLLNLPIKVLPGIGHVLEEKLNNHNIQTCGQLRLLSKEALQKDFGMKTGDMLWHYSRGIDNRAVDGVQETKSIGAEVNWGVRFTDGNDSQHFLVKICKEVSLRLQGCGMQGRTITLKIRKRRKGAEEPTKFMGCGDCENLSHSVTVPSATNDADVLLRISKQLFASFHLDDKEVRGIGFQVSRLETADLVKQGNKNILKSWLSSASESGGKQSSSIDPVKGRANAGNCAQLPNNVGNGSSYKECNKQCDADVCVNDLSTLPPISHLDLAVLESLPPEIILEINEMYSGRLTDIIERNSVKGVGKATVVESALSLSEVEGGSDGFQNLVCDTVWKEPSGQSDFLELKPDARDKGKQPLQFPVKIPTRSKALKLEVEGPTDGNNVKENLLFQTSFPDKINQVNQRKFGEIPSAFVSPSGPADLPVITGGQADLMPASLSQVDISVLEQLPDELKHDILGLLPPHRTSGCLQDSVLGSVRGCSDDTLEPKNTEDSTGRMGFVSETNLWTGKPPKWVVSFRLSHCFVLKILADCYATPGTNGLFSSTLQHFLSSFPSGLVCSSNEWDEAFSSFSELLKQYIVFKINSDIEEIYICFRLLKRFTRRSTFFFELYNMVLPFLQDSVGENYGGSLLV